ncbi:MAG: DUF3565 domain-containing protein [Deltaproteobacteria bacterium]|nr:DUF3565 domain-containing protein [Deltaproteobacteria bacterium]
MIRRIIKFELDEENEWRVLLSCGHRQHVRHKPPFFIREWAASEEGRRSKINTPLDCPLCDRILHLGKRPPQS